VVTAS